MQITDIKAHWTENKDFSFYQKSCGNKYVFLHFLSPAVLHSDYCDIPILPGACILFNKHTKQHFSASKNEICFNQFHLKGDLSDQMHKYELRFNQIYYPENNVFVTQLVRALEYNFHQPYPFSEEYVCTKVNELLILLTQTVQPNTATITKAATCALFESIRDTITSHYSEPLDTDQMAALANMSRTAFCKQYKRQFGITPKQDLILCRIQHAKYLCLQGKHTIKQIAKACGYTNSTHFSRQFKAITGVVPSKYICL